MGFSQATITSVNPPVPSGGQYWISWTSSSPVGTWFQVYLNEQLAWAGQQTAIWLPIPTGGASRVDIGTVLAGEEQTNYSSSLPAGPNRTVELTWLGGTYEAPDLAGFHVYGEASPSAGIIYTTPLATITAYPSGIFTDGFGFGGFGYGGFGESSSSYSWTSKSLTSGTWNWAVKPFDQAGNLGSAMTTAVVIAVPPFEPAAYPDRSRLKYTYQASPIFEVTLDWNASPG